MEQVSVKPISPPSPIQVLIKDEIHEDIQFDFNDEPSQQSQASTRPLSGSDSDSDVSIVLSAVTPIKDLSSNLDQPKSTSKYNFRNKQKKPTVSVPEQNANESPFFCKACAICLSGKEQFEIHQSGHENNLRCNLCTMILKNFKNYEKHVAKCKPFECKICGKTIRFRPNFIKHMRIHNPKNVTSTTGTDGTSTIDGSRSNKKVPKAERHKYKCATCDKEFTSWEYFKVHQKIHVNDVNLKCDICDRTFSALACLRGHQKVHTGERPFRCKVCGKEFGQSYNLKIHSRLHSGEKPFECKVCGRKMNTTASYNAHIKTHKDFKCAICNETFNQKMKYMSHMGMHETGKVLECNICGKKFGRSSNFYNHQRIHLGIRKFKCYICGQGFVKAANLDAHLLIHCDTDEIASTNSCTVEEAVEQSPIPSTSATQTDVAAKSVASTSVSLVASSDDHDKSYERILFGAGDDVNAHQSDDNDSVEANDKFKLFHFDNTQQTFSSYDSMYSL